MRRDVIAIWLTSAIALLCPAAALADPTKSISPFVSGAIERTIHGDAREVDLSRLGRGLGRTEAFFGVDAESTVDTRYLTSGLQWRSSGTSAPFLRASALRTEGEDTALAGGQTLMRLENRVDLGGRWYMPDLSIEIVQASNLDANSDLQVGRAARVGLTQEMGAGEVTLGYFQADPQFSALGSAIVAGDRGLDLHSRQRLGESWRLAHELRLHQPSALRSESAMAQTLVLSRRSRLTDMGQPWQLRAELGAPIDAQASDSTPLALEIASQTLGWRDWRVDSTLGWYDASMGAPLSLPVDGALWQFSARRGVNIAGLRAELSPNFAFGGSRYQGRGRGTRTGLNLGVSQLSDHLDLSMSYLSAGWAATPQADGDVQMMLEFRRSTGAILPGLRSMAKSLRLPWVPRR